MQISSTASLSGTMNTAIGAINKIERKVEDIASQVASGVSNEVGSSATEITASLAQLPALREQAQANARVIEVADELLTKVPRL